MVFRAVSAALLKTAFSNGAPPPGSIMTAVCRRTVASAVVGIASSMPSAAITPQQVRHASTKKATKSAATTDPKTILMDAVATTRTDVSTARGYIDSANQAIASALLEVFDAHVGVAMLKCGSAKVTPTIIPYNRFLGYDPAIHSVAYVGGLLKAYKDQSVKEAETKLVKAETKLVKAKAELKEAKAELKEAEVKLVKAKAELKEAEVKLKKGEAKLNVLEATWCSVGEIISIVTNKSNQKLFVQLEEKGKGVRRAGTITQLQIIFNQPPPTTTHSSFALVLAGTNGVGKTYISFYIGSGAMDTLNKRVVSAYCGMNSGWPLSASEGNRIVKHGFQGLRTVVYTRVALALQHRATNMDKPWECLNYFMDKSMSINDATVIIKDALMKIRGQCRVIDPNCEVFVFGVVDEVQLFSTYASSRNQLTTLGTPRLALRILREIQVEVYKDTGVVFVGLSTGTIYEAMLGDKTHGDNFFLSNPFCSLKDFLNLEPRDGTDWAKLTAHQTKRMKYMAYPRARLLEHNISNWASLIVVKKAAAQLLLPAALSRKSLSIKKFNNRVVFLGGCLAGVDEYEVLDDYLLMLACVKALTPYQPSHPAPYVDNCESFERQVGEVLMCIVALGSSNRSGKAVRGAVVDNNQWLRTMLKGTSGAIPILDHYQNYTLDHSKKNYMPFTSTKSLMAAIGRGVHRDVKKYVNAMQNESSLLLHCGGSAPFDFILFVKLGKSLRIALVDAKHSENGNRQGDKNAKEMYEKYELVRAGLKVEYSDAEFAPPFIMTNKTAPSNTRGVKYLSRDTMKLGGLTRVLFDHLD